VGEGIKLGALQVLGWPADGQGGDDTAEMIKDWRRDRPQILDELPVFECEAMLSDLVMVASVRPPWLFSHLSTTFARARQATLVANIRIDSFGQTVGVAETAAG
jgi:hypothetical protein